MLNNTIPFFGINLRIYSLLFLGGIFAAMELSKAAIMKKHPNQITNNQFDNLALAGIFGGLIGARLWFVMSMLEYYMANPIEIVQVWKGGIAIQGGIIGTYLAIRWLLKKYQIKFTTLTLFEEVAIFLLPAQAFGRWGNFYNQEVYGYATTQSTVASLVLICVIAQTILMMLILKPHRLLKDKSRINSVWLIKIFAAIFYIVMLFRVTATSYGASVVQHLFIDGQFRIPLFLIEGTLNMVAFIIIWWLNKERTTTLKLPMYLIAYGTIRASLELFRNERDIMRISGIPVSFVMSLIFIAIGIMLIVKKVKETK